MGSHIMFGGRGAWPTPLRRNRGKRKTAYGNGAKFSLKLSGSQRQKIKPTIGPRSGALRVWISKTLVCRSVMMTVFLCTFGPSGNRNGSAAGLPRNQRTPERRAFFLALAHAGGADFVHALLDYNDKLCTGVIFLVCASCGNLVCSCTSHAVAFREPFANDLRRV